MSPQGAPRILLDLLSIKVPKLEGMTGQYNLEEIERNLCKRFPELFAIYQDYLPKLRLEIIPLPHFSQVEILLGKMSAKDAPVLASALAGQADYLITGDKRGFPAKVARPIVVIPPDHFLNNILPKIIRED